MPDRIPLYYTFGNHQHWADMEWLWGYFVLPASVRDMLYFCRETGAKGNVNFDGIGYEKMAVEAPEALAELREAVVKGQIEIVGGSYGQPYGLFHGGESNVRQRAYGVRTILRLFGVRPKTFWEEEFDFFPQLPQMLKGVGYEYGSLFFQWTWHTPAVPHEKLPAIWWEGVDGSRLLASPRNDLNLHQWPEDFAGLLESPLLEEMPVPGIVQWLELMPSPDWMCRAELLLPQLRMLMDHPRLDLRFATLSEYLDAARPHAEPRRYTLDDVFHGMSLGKNGDLFRRLSRRSEQSALTAESLSALSGMFGRPYPSWDVYPTWELEEAWRELLSAQHHDNEECEGLCGFVGQRSYERSLSMTNHITQRSLRWLANRSSGPAGRTVVYNPLGWSRDAAIPTPDGNKVILLKDLPPLGYRTIPNLADGEAIAPVSVEQDGATITLRRGTFSVTVDKARGVLSQLISPDFPDGVLSADLPLATLQMKHGGQADSFEDAVSTVTTSQFGPTIEIQRSGRDGAKVIVLVSLAPELDAVDVVYRAVGLPRPDPWLHAALRTTLGVSFLIKRLVRDYAYGLSETRAEGKYLRKYPTGEWMTSPQVFEEVHNPFTALQLLDFDGGERGLLYLHDGSPAFQRDQDHPERIHNILSMYDAWDEDYFIDTLEARFRLLPHGAMTDAERWKHAQEFTRPVLTASTSRPGGNLPAELAGVTCDAPGVALTAFFRETEESGNRLNNYAGTGMGFPYVIRLVELNGEPAVVTLRLAGQAAAAVRTNLVGETTENLAVTKTGGPGSQVSQVTLTLRAHEIATVYVDLVNARKVPRNLDEFRHVWATVHRVDEKSE